MEELPFVLNKIIIFSYYLQMFSWTNILIFVKHFMFKSIWGDLHGC